MCRRRRSRWRCSILMLREVAEYARECVSGLDGWCKEGQPGRLPCSCLAAFHHVAKEQQWFCPHPKWGDPHLAPQRPLNGPLKTEWCVRTAPLLLLFFEGGIPYLVTPDTEASATSHPHERIITGSSGKILGQVKVEPLLKFHGCDAWRIVIDMSSASFGYLYKHVSTHWQCVKFYKRHTSPIVARSN